MREYKSQVANEHIANRRRERQPPPRATLICCFAAVLLCCFPSSASPFATSVRDYRPAPGQFINNPGQQGISFNDPLRALGPPVGGGSQTADNSKVVTLGGFGGSLTLGFDHTILDAPCNPLGLDCIVFGNAYWVGNDPARRWAECATIEISLDANANGVADDAWYLIPGSSLPSPASVFRTQPWDNNPATPTPPANIAWYPAAPAFPNWPATYSTSAYELPTPLRGPVVVNPSGLPPGAEGYFGYADLTPTLLRGDMSGATGAPGHDNLLTDPEDQPAIDPARFYTVPDDPRTLGVTAGSGGGDAFDIASAINPATGAPANLPGFDFIRITTAIDAVTGPGGALGEVSAEISAVAAVRSPFPGDTNDDGVVNFVDLNIVLSNFGALAHLPGDANCDNRVDFLDLNIVLSNFGMSTPR